MAHMSPEKSALPHPHRLGSNNMYFCGFRPSKGGWYGFSFLMWLLITMASPSEVKVEDWKGWKGW